MTDLKEITLSLVAAKNARDDARHHWKEVSGGEVETHLQAREAARVAQMNLEHYSRLFSNILTELRQEELLMLSIDALDPESLVNFRRMVAALELDEYTQPVAYASFEQLATTWRKARRFLKAACAAESRARMADAAELVEELEQLIDDEPEESYADALKGWQHLYSLAGKTEDDQDVVRGAALKLVRYARVQLENVTAALSGKVAGMRAQELRGALASLDADLGLELKRALDEGLVPCSRHVLAEPQWEPEPQVQTRTAVGTLVREDQEVDDEPQLTPEHDALVDKLLREAYQGRTDN